MGLDIPDNLLALGEAVCFSVTRQQITTPRAGALELLSYLKTNNYKIGLISDCHYDVPEIWNETPFAPYFDVTVFSCQAGMNKADPRIFRIALEKLAVTPDKCMYIADGMRQELANASKLGMRAVQILVPEEIDDIPLREDWHGPVISSLNEILALL
jgi:FMN phosphatase YigB (HAD superfamily)